MPRPRLYIETTIPSWYYTERSDPKSVARKLRTREWWDEERANYELVTSSIVLQELSAGPEGKRERWLEILRGVPVLPLDAPVAEIVQAYLLHKLMPANPSWDAFHLAFASYSGCEYLLTWNCRHLANANKFGHISRINTKLGLFVPTITTPENLGREG